jgi:hypothetical protein
MAQPPGTKRKSFAERVAEVVPPVTITPEQLATIAAQVPPTDISGKVDKVTNKSLVLDTEIVKIHNAGSDNQDLSGLQPKETGKGLSTNDYTAEEKNKLAGISGGLTQSQILTRGL